MRKCKYIHGIGINDLSNEAYGFFSDGYRKVTSYSVWVSILSKVASKSYNYYRGASIHPDWIYYSVFRDWFDANYVEGYELNRSILNQDNLVYGPDTCLLVPSWVNRLFAKSISRRSRYGTGVVKGRRGSNKFIVTVRKFGKGIMVGSFTDVTTAQAAYKVAKGGHICDLILCEPMPYKLRTILYTKGLDLMSGGLVTLYDSNIELRPEFLYSPLISWSSMQDKYYA